MYNEAARRTALGLMREDFNQLNIPLRSPEGLPNLGEVWCGIRITDTSVIVRAAIRRLHASELFTPITCPALRVRNAEGTSALPGHYR